MTEEQEAELRWRLNTLKVALEEGRMRFAEHLADDVERSLGAVRYNQDGEIDLDTVDARTRSLALATAFFHQRELTKNAISLYDISNTYFEFIEANLGFLKNKADNDEVSAQQLAAAISNNPEAVEDLSAHIPAFLEALGGFWDGVSESAEYHVQDLQGTKAVFGGDLFPSHERNIASALGLYVDTIVLSDPFWHSKSILETYPPEQAVYYLVKHAVNLLQYKELATSNPAAPIIVILPFKSSIDEDEADLVKRLAEADGLKHASNIFGQEFETVEQLFGFVEPLRSPDLVAPMVRDEARLLFDTEWGGTKLEQIARSVEGLWGDATGGDQHAGRMVASTCLGRMLQSTDLLLKSRFLGATPLIDAPTSWQYFNWKLEYNAAESADEHTPMQIIKGLQFAASADEPWLNKIPPSALIEMRETGAFADIRRTITDGVDDVSKANPDNFYRVGDRIVDNIRTAFDEHRREVAELRERSVRFAGHDLGTMVAAGALDLTSIVVGTPTFGAASYMANQLVDVPKLREIPAKYRELRDAHRELRRSPMGLFFKHRD